MIMSNSPIFIVGTERSGSNLLRLLLDSHSQISIPHPPHILRYFAPLEAGYGDLSDRNNLRRLAQDVIRLLEVHIHPWESLPDPDLIVSMAKPMDLFGIFVAIYEWHQQEAGKARWGCKSTFMIDHVNRVLARFPDAKFIWLVRDPRDVAASSRESVFNPCHPYLTATLWCEQQRIGLDYEELLPKANWSRLLYEDLIAEPEQTLRELCGFLGENFEPQMLRFFETPEAKRSASLSQSWANTASPVQRDKAGKYRKTLNEREIRLVEDAAGEVMAQLGYKLDFEPSGFAASQPSPVELAIGEFVGRCRVEWKSLRRDRNHWQRWRRDWEMALLGVRYGGLSNSSGNPSVERQLTGG
jgi:hypothetical protein